MTDNKNKNKETYANLQESTQTFGGIGLLEVVHGNLVLRGRSGVRDHLYPLHQAIKRYGETIQMVLSMAKHAIRGWDTLYDVTKDMKAKILEAIRERRSLNMDIPDVALDFERINEAGGGKVDVKSK